MTKGPTPPPVDLPSEQRRTRHQAALSFLVCGAVLGPAIFLLPQAIEFPLDVPGRIAFVLRADIFVATWVMIGVRLVSRTRFVSAADNAGSAYGPPSDRLAVRAAFLQNTTLRRGSSKFWREAPPGERRREARNMRNLSSCDRSKPSLWGALRRGCYPHQLSWLIDNPVRRLIIRPETLANRLPLSPTSRILEVGAGSGYFSRELARRVPEGRLELLDLQPEMLAKAMRRFGKPPPRNVGSTAADACRELPYKDENFDVVLLVAVLGELPAPDRALASLYRVLAPGGTLAIHEHWPDPDIVRLEPLRSLVEGQGFRFMRSQGRTWNYMALFSKPAPSRTS